MEVVHLKEVLCNLLTLFCKEAYNFSLRQRGPIKQKGGLFVFFSFHAAADFQRFPERDSPAAGMQKRKGETDQT